MNQVHPLEHTLSIVGPIVGAVVLLTVFFKFMGWIGQYTSARPQHLGLRGVLDAETPVTIHLSNGNIHTSVRIVGFTDATSVKGRLPYELHNMVILEDHQGARLLVPAKLIRLIEVPPQDSRTY